MVLDILPVLALLKSLFKRGKAKRKRVEVSMEVDPEDLCHSFAGINHVSPIVSFCFSYFMVYIL